MPFLLIGAIIISFSAVLVRIAHVEPSVSAFYRAFFAFLALAAYHLATRRPLLSGTKTWAMMLVCGLAFVLDLSCWHVSIIYIGPGLATLLGNFQVIILAGVAVLIDKEPVGGRFALSITAALAGLALITGLDLGGYTPQYRTGLLLGLATAVFYAVYLLSLKNVLSRPGGRDPVAAMTTLCGLSSAIFFAILTASGASPAIPDPETGASLLALGLICQVGGWLLISRGLSGVPARYAGLILLLQPTLSFTWDVLFFHRPFGLRECAGAALALAGIYLGSVRPPASGDKGLETRTKRRQEGPSFHPRRPHPWL